MQTVFARLRDVFSPDRLGDLAARFVPNLIVALATFLAIYLVWRAIDRGLESLLDRSEVDPTAAQFTRTVFKYIVLTVAAVSALEQVGVNTTSILASLGIVGLTIGFAARDALSNTISGLFIFWDRPFVIGDLIELDDHYGRVENITMRSTRVVTPDGKMLAIPNTAVSNAVVTSYTNFPHLRLDLEFGIDVDEDLDLVRRTLLETVDSDPELLDDREPEVVVESLNDFNNTIKLRVWLEDVHDHIRKRFELRERAYRKLKEAGVDMPYETFEIRESPEQSADRAG